MSLSDILFLYRARLRARTVLVQECFAILGIAVGVALLFASQVASTSLTRSVAELSQQIVGNTRFQLDARGPRGFDERLLGEVRTVPGVRIALPVLEQQASVIGPSGARSVDLIGTDPRFAHFAGPLLRRFSAIQLAAQQAIALPAPVAQAIGAGPLQTVRLQAGASAVTTLLGATLEEADIGGLIDSPVAFAPVGYAQRITGMQGRITRIFVQPQPGRDREVQAGLTKLAVGANLNLEPADFDSTLFAVAAAPQSKSESLFSAISALVGFMFALNAMLITAPARRKLIEDVRPQGATRMMTAEILMFDAFVLGVLACVFGLAFGEVLSVAVFHSTPGYLSFAFPIGNSRIVTWSSVALAVGAGMAAACLGVLWPLRDILVRPLQAMEAGETGIAQWVWIRMGLGSLCLLATTFVLVVSPQDATFGSFTLLVALACLLPPMFDGLVSLFDWAQRPFNGASTVMAVTELRTPPTRVRSLAIAATAAVAVFGTVAIQGAQSNLERGLEGSARAVDASADVWITPGGEFDAFSTTPFGARDRNVLAGIPGVAELGVYRGSFLNWGPRRLWVLAPPRASRQPIGASQLMSANAALVTARLRAGGWAVLSKALAAEHELHVGQAFTLPAPRPMTFKVAALSTNLGWSPGSLVINSQDYARAWESEDPSAYAIQTRPGVSVATVRRLALLALGAHSGLTVETYVERERRHYALARQGLSRLTQIRLMVLIAAMLAIGGAIGALIWQRRDLVAFIKCEGYYQGVLWRWLLCESIILLVSGCLIGAIFGIYGELLLSHALASVTGFPMVFHVGVTIALTSFVLVSVVAVVIVALAGYLVVRVPPRTVSPAY
ncbi:MAG TPA: FtsX-like permease family protein [Solirubrobacteraceae bacterium]|jgi:putative ABC transport system permease protein|nr:FtsX-like permease family protein [Solirubrobacteraceae bacterium]